LIFETVDLLTPTADEIFLIESPHFIRPTTSRNRCLSILLAPISFTPFVGVRQPGWRAARLTAQPTGDDLICRNERRRYRRKDLVLQFRERFAEARKFLH
jgi:hypothetical protein